MLDNRFASLLSGRYFANVVRPFSMRERLKISGFTNLFSLQTRRPEAIRVMNDYLQWGGFPETVLHEMTDDVKTELLQSYYDSIVLKDCVAYSRIRDTELFYRLLHFLLTNVGNIFNYSSLARSLSSNENTVRNYLSYASRSYVLADVTNFSWSLKTGSRAEHKAYCIDNGLMNAISFRFSSQKGALLENAVYNELCNKGYADITFVKNNRECDFVARKDGCFHAFQVYSELMDQNSLREQQGFKCLTGVTETASYTIITFNQHEEIDGVQVLPFYVWAMKG